MTNRRRDMARSLTIDADFLRSHRACRVGAERFLEAFPDGVTLTDDQWENFEAIGGRLARYSDDPPCGCPGVSSEYGWLLGQLGYEPDVPRNVGCGGFSCSHDEFLIAGLLADAVGRWHSEGRGW